MDKKVSYLIQGKNIILAINGQSYVINKDTHIAYAKIVQALKDNDWDAIEDLVEPKKAILSYGSGNISIKGDKLFWKDKEFHNALASRLINMYQDGFPVEPMVNFMERLMANPSKTSVDQLYGFLEKNNLPITEDGYFLAFKKVKSGTYLDIHSGTIVNKVGSIVEMERNEVDDNPARTCSTGLHFCSVDYLRHFGSTSDPVMILKIDPADVVSIPTDYNGSKGRCCRYIVVGEVDGDPNDAFACAVNGDFTSFVYEEVDTASWPFNDSDSSDETELFDLVRVHDETIVEYTDATKAEADEIIERHRRQKKAALKAVPARS